MATQIEIKNSIVKQIASEFFNKIDSDSGFNYGSGDNVKVLNSVEDFRKIISGGGVSTTTGQQNQIVLYQQNYQQQTPPNDFDLAIESITKCFCLGNITVNLTFGHECDVEYDDYINITMNFYDGAGTVDNPYEIFTFETSDGCLGLNAIDLTITDSLLSILSQYIPFDYTQINIDPTQAQQVLDTNIFELMPQQTLRQEQINTFFSTYSNLKGEYPVTPWLDTNEDGILDGIPGQPTIPRDGDNISTGGQSIDRTIDYASEINETQNLEWLRDDLNRFLEDVDQQGVDDLDDRPEYEDKSDGYLKIRHMNQAIIVRKEEGTDVGLMKEVTNDVCVTGGPSYLCDGFTITMWVKFLDKINTGTLFNFGNPLRENNPMGFMLETFVVNKDEYNTPPEGYFTDGDTERFIRLVIRESDLSLRDSHIGITNSSRLNTTNVAESEETITNNIPALEHNINYAFNHTRVPIDLTEWYFIVANYNPTISEVGYVTYAEDPDYWRWNKEGTDYMANSGLGAKCKVEIISKSDLLRARGFKPQDS